jgi:hypothetical protein
LYQRPDDKSNALTARETRVGHRFDINEFPVYLGDPKETSVSVSGAGTDVQTIDIGNLHETDDIMGFSFVKDDPSIPATPSDKVFRQTIWEVLYGGDQLVLGLNSTSFDGVIDNEDSIATREDEARSRKTEKIPFYQTASFFSGKRRVFKHVFINTQTGQEEITSPSLIKLKPVVNPHVAAKIKDVKISSIRKENVIRDVADQALFNYRGARKMILFTRLQGAFGNIGTDGIVDSTTPVLNTTATPSSSNHFGIDMAQNGVFIITTVNEFRSYVSGLFPFPSSPDSGDGEITTVTDRNLYRFPYLMIPNLSNAVYTFDVSDSEVIHVAGYSKIGERGVLSLVYFSVNLTAAFVASTYSVSASTDDIGSKPVLSHSSLFNERNVILTSGEVTGDISGATNEPDIKITSPNHKLIIGDFITISDVGGNTAANSETPVKVISSGNNEFTISTDGSSSGVYTSGGQFTLKRGFVSNTLESRPLSIVSHLSFQLIFFEENGVINFISSANEGATWAFYDDLLIARGTVTSPRANIVHEEVFLFYIKDGEQLYLKRIPLVLLITSHGSIDGKRTSELTDSTSVSVKQDLQASFDNIEEVFVSFTSDQQIDFAITDRGTLRTAYFNDNLDIKADETINEGFDIDAQPKNA